MWFYHRAAKPKMTQALIAEVPEFDFPAAVEETGSLNLDLSVHNSSSINLLAKQKKNSQAEGCRRQHLEPRSLHFTDAHAQKQAGVKAFSSPPTGEKTLNF